jgi:choline dehydrogenase-like flavoprotein
MFLDGRQVEAGAEVAAQICIVGAGAAGITLACEFVDSGLDVCLLESGALDFDWTRQDLYRGENVGLPYFALDVCQIRYFGGNTNAWGGWCRPMDETDLLPRPWIEDSGWPFDLAELAPYYGRAHNLCQLLGTEYSPQEWVQKLRRAKAELLAFDPARVETTVYQFSPPTRFGTVYRERIRQAGNIRCFLHTNALRIRTLPQLGEVTRLEVAARPGAPFSISAKLFVLAAGGTENPRLLLLSNDVAPNGLGNDHDRVGRYFMEHPHTRRRVIAQNHRAPIGLYGLGLHKHRVSARFALPRELQKREELLNYSANLHPIYRGHDSEGWIALRKLVLRISRSRSTDPFLRFPPYGKKEIRLADFFQIARHLNKTTLAAFLQLLQPASFVEGFILESKSEQAPNPESRITLRRERDAFGQNRIGLDWRMLPIDRRTVCRGEEILDQELQRLGIGRLEPLSADGATRWPDNLEGGWHQLGMTRMHADPKRGVVDADGRVHGIGNLFVTGGSVFPTSGAAPPTLTIVALALRLADHLKTAHVASRQLTARFAADAVPEPLMVARTSLNSSH